MSISTTELDRPTEWLMQLRTQEKRYQAFLRDAGSLVEAAFRLARARCRVQAVSTDVPSFRELRAAVREICRHTEAGLMSDGQLAAECTLQRLPVILPLNQSAA